MRQRGIWIAICLILVIGMFSTSYVRRHTGRALEMPVRASLEAAAGQEGTVSEREAVISQRETAAAFSSGSVADVPVPYSAAQREDEKGTKISSSQEKEDGPGAFPAAIVRVATAAEAEPSRQQDAKAARSLSMEEEAQADHLETDLDLSLAGPKGKSADAQDMALEDTDNPALVRLQDLDSQIARNRARDTEWTANSRKASAESEWKLWETEVQRMLGILRERLDSSQQDELMRQQREWMRNREGQAVDASKKQMGSSMEEVSYSRSLAELTRARAYELAQDYEEYFKEAKKP